MLQIFIIGSGSNRFRSCRLRSLQHIHIRIQHHPDQCKFLRSHTAPTCTSPYLLTINTQHVRFLLLSFAGCDVTSGSDSNDDVTLSVVSSFQVTEDRSFFVARGRLWDVHHSWFVLRRLRLLFVVRLTGVGVGGDVVRYSARDCLNLTNT